MEIPKNKSTKTPLEEKNLLITDALEVFNLLLEVGIKKGMNIPELSDKTDINRQSMYRYKSSFESQKKCNPSMSKIIKLANALGYEIRLFKKSEDNVDN